MNILPKFILAAGLAALGTATLQAQPFARGNFNDWGTAQLNDDGDGSYSLTVSGGTPGAFHEWKVDPVGDWATSFPGQNAKARYDAYGEFTFHWYPGQQNDGWRPIANRIGFSDPGNMPWEIMGQFNNWDDNVDTAARQMSSNGNGLYTVTYTIPNPGTYAFKFRAPGSWDYAVGNEFSPGSGDASVTTTEPNEAVTFQLDLPRGRWLAGDPLPAPTNQVTFIVDMAVPINEYPSTSGFDPNSDTVYVRGSFNNWQTQPELALTRMEGTTVYSNTVEIVGYSGTQISYKFYGDPFPMEETPLLSCNAARMITLNGGNMTAPLAYWSDRQITSPTNEIRVRVDMAVQIATGAFDPASDQVYARGTFNNWQQTEMTATENTNIYEAVLTLPNWPIGSCVRYKFFHTHPGAPNGGWESPIGTGGGDREFIVTSSMQTNATLSFNDIEICDVLEETTMVTFSVNMAGAVGAEGTPVYDGTQNVYINGDFLGWWSWGNAEAAAPYQMTKAGDVYSITLPVAPGNNLMLTYKYSMDTSDNEAGFGINHTRYIRTTAGPTDYVMPQDAWIGSNTNANLRAETKFGSLVAVPGQPGEVQLEWMGLKCVQLQSTTNLTSPFWTTHAGTDGNNSAVMPTTDDQRFFRLFDVSP